MSMRDQLEEKYGKPHLSYSSLKYALGDMRQWEKYMRGTLFKESDALRFGSLYDCLLLTPNEAPNQYVRAVNQGDQGEERQGDQGVQGPHKGFCRHGQGDEPSRSEHRGLATG